MLYFRAEEKRCQSLYSDASCTCQWLLGEVLPVLLSRTSRLLAPCFLVRLYQSQSLGLKVLWSWISHFHGTITVNSPVLPICVPEVGEESIRQQPTVPIPQLPAERGPVHHLHPCSLSRSKSFSKVSNCFYVV